ncbi:MAG: 3-deoxy-manno-octulosonate cytidylyltransferase [Gammaproteobacteria bacterium]|nr:3-deoxy-manno-octulosonate cytidylyltransferase [Gammaproteobacteria bacterium]
MSGFSVVIPARYASSRLPGKPLLEINGKPMIQHAWKRATESGAARVIVATDDYKIRSTAEGFGAEAVMTSTRHQSGTDRIHEAVNELELDDDEIVVNLQGDEPLMPPANIEQVAELVAADGVDIATLSVPLDDRDDFLNPNVVKVVVNQRGNALYFSRAPIPWDRDGAPGGVESQMSCEASRRHLGIYAYKVGSLREFASAPPAQLERLEKLEQLRALAMGQIIRVANAREIPPGGVDTEADLARVRKEITRRG